MDRMSKEALVLIGALPEDSDGGTEPATSRNKSRMRHVRPGRIFWEHPELRPLRWPVVADNCAHDPTARSVCRQPSAVLAPGRRP